MWMLCLLFSIIGAAIGWMLRELHYDWENKQIAKRQPEQHNTNLPNFSLLIARGEQLINNKT